MARHRVRGETAGQPRVLHLPGASRGYHRERADARAPEGFHRTEGAAAAQAVESRGGQLGQTHQEVARARVRTLQAGWQREGAQGRVLPGRGRGGQGDRGTEERDGASAVQAGAKEGSQRRCRRRREWIRLVGSDAVRAFGRYHGVRALRQGCPGHGIARGARGERGVVHAAAGRQRTARVIGAISQPDISPDSSPRRTMDPALKSEWDPRRGLYSRCITHDAQRIVH
mmetsp:Transcript_4161/g.11276  ORF Transcript_4161/g.11276 Transcript_4161/m.11276 type:complete len:228 (-) Transcript_4161:29-712(-)